MKQYKIDPASPEDLDHFESRVRQLVGRIDREREVLKQTAEPLRQPIDRVEHWQKMAERLVTMLPALLFAAAGLVLVLWLSGRWSTDRVMRWLAFAGEIWALWEAVRQNPAFKAQAAAVRSVLH